MGFSFSEADFERIRSTLGAILKTERKLARFTLFDEDSGRKLELEIHTALGLPESMQDRPANLVSVYATNSFLQLHGCTGYIASEELGEVIFFGKQGGSTNGLVVERGAGTSLYANVDSRMLSTDFTQLPPEVMMSSVALSMTETLFNDMN
jgi:hypothetical protein